MNRYGYSYQLVLYTFIIYAWPNCEIWIRPWPNCPNFWPNCPMAELSVDRSKHPLYPLIIHANIVGRLIIRKTWKKARRAFGSKIFYGPFGTMHPRASGSLVHIDYWMPMPLRQLRWPQRNLIFNFLETVFNAVSLSNAGDLPDIAMPAGAWTLDI